MDQTLTIEQLRSLSLPQSFERGESLYAGGAVRKLAKVGNHFSAEVQGSYRYQLTIDLEQNPPYAACSCPFDGSGWCKHLVAAGIAISKAEWTEEVNEIVGADFVGDGSFYEQVFLKAEKEMQQAFLHQLFAQREDMQKAFRLFAEPPKVVSFKQVVDVRKRSEQQANELNPLEQRIEYSKALMKAQLAEIEDEEFVNHFMEENTKNAVRVMLPGIEIIEQLGEESDCLGVIATLLGTTEFVMTLHRKYNDVIDKAMLSVVQEQIREVNLFWKKQLIPKAFYKSAIELIIDRWSFLRARGDEGAFSLSLFSQLLKTLASDEIPARYLLFRLEAFAVELSAEVPGLFVYAAEKAGDKKAFERYTERFWTKEANVARLFLAHLKKYNDEDFYKKAHEAFKIFGVKIAWFLSENLDEKEAPDLYQNVFQLLISKEQSTTLYKAWRASATKDERDAFIDEQKEEEHFYLQLLIIEEKHEAIRLLAKEKKADQLMDYLLPILEAYPDFCFSRIKDTVTALLAKASNRETYRFAASLIQLARQIPGYREKANDLHKRYDALGWPALSDELNMSQDGGWTIYVDE